jgi:hypothetical protein
VVRPVRQLQAVDLLTPHRAMMAQSPTLASPARMGSHASGLAKPAPDSAASRRRAPRSEAARAKDSRHTRPDGGTLHDLATLLNHLATLTRNTIVFAGGVRIDKLAVPTPLQRQAFELIGAAIPTQLRST